MQEDIQNKTVALIINAAKLTGRELKAAMSKFLAAQKNAAQKNQSRGNADIPHGKQSIKDLIKQNTGISNIEVTEKNIKDFERVARKYGVDFAVKKDSSVAPPKYLVFFKGRDADAITAAFKEYTANVMKKEQRPSVLAQLKKFAELVKNTVIDRVKNKDKEQSR